MVTMSKKWIFNSYIKPGNQLSSQGLSTLSLNLLAVANQCFEQVPHYQCLTDKREDFSDKLIVTASDSDGNVRAFQSAVIIPIPHIGNVLHTGLMCVAPSVRHHGIGHALFYHSLKAFLFQYQRTTHTWITNVSSIYAVLANLAYYCKDLYPSPTCSTPSAEQRLISHYFAQHCRHLIDIDQQAAFDKHNFLFQAGNLKNSFLKCAEDANQHYYKADRYNRFYQTRMSPQRGDAVLQVGHLSIFDAMIRAGYRAALLQQM